MTLNGTVKQGSIVSDDPLALPEGARVEIVVIPAEDKSQTLRDTLLKHAGCLTGLPADMAEQHDHFIHGTPKR
jgi:hypothetical protein